jgi:hypothetical protein
LRLLLAFYCDFCVYCWLFILYRETKLSFASGLAPGLVEQMRHELARAHAAFNPIPAVIVYPVENHPAQPVYDEAVLHAGKFNRLPGFYFGGHVQHYFSFIVYE